MTSPELCRTARCLWLAAILIVPISGCGSSSDTSAIDPSASPSADAVTQAPVEDQTPTEDLAPGDQPPDETLSADPPMPEPSGTESTTVAPEPSSTPDAEPNVETPSDDAEPEAEAPSVGVKLSGRVLFDGPPPERRVVNMKVEKEGDCIKLHGGEPVLDEAVIVADDGGVMNAFVYVRRGAPDREYPMPEQPARLDQKGCMYRPRIQGVRVGQTLLVANNDPLTHNVRSFPIRSRPFNFGQKADSDPRERIFERAEREIEVQCDIHRWMHAYLFVMDHPFFNVSADDGAFAIDGLPPGEYTLEAWHETLGKQRRTVTVGDDKVEGFNFTFEP